MSTRTPAQAYEELLGLWAQIRGVCDSVKGFFTYSPFDHLPGKIQGELMDIRGRLIENRAEHFRQLYTPNLKPTEDFKKLMHDRCGEMGFNEAVLEEWFKAKAQDPQQLSGQSLEQLVHAARHLVPYWSQGGEWSYEKDWHQLVDKISPRLLVLRCYSWTGARYSSGVNYNLNAEHELDALEALVEVAALPGRDPATVKPKPWITAHVQYTREDPVKFYGRHLVDGGPVEAFQFFKNEKLLVWFDKAQDAEAVAKVLTTGQIQGLPTIAAAVPS